MYIYRVPRYMGNVVFESLVWLSTIWMYRGWVVYMDVRAWDVFKGSGMYVFMRHIVDGAIRM